MTELETRVPTQPDISIRHLEAELMRVDVLLHREVWRWQQAGQDRNDVFRGQYLSDEEANSLVQRPFAMSWGQTKPLRSGEKQAYTSALERISQHAQALVETARQRSVTLRLAHLADSFGLDRFDLDTLLACLAPTLDLRYKRLYGYLQDDVTRCRPSVNLMINMLCLPGSNRLMMAQRFADDAPLFKHYILELVSEPGMIKPPRLDQTLVVDEAVVAWLVGKYQPHADLGDYAALSYPQANQADDLLAARVIPDLEGIANAGDAPLVVFHGPDRSSQKAAARLLAARAGRPLLMVELNAIVKSDVAPLRALRLAMRDALLAGAILCLTGWDVCLSKSGSVPVDLFAELCAHPDMVIVAGRASWYPAGVDRSSPLLWVQFPTPNYAQRCALWQHFLDRAGAEGELDITALAGQFLLTTGQIRDVVASARDKTAQRGERMHDQALFAAARSHSSSRLVGLARKIVPRYTWDDIVLPRDQLTMLQEIVSTVRGRPKVLEQWGVGKKLVASAGIPSLFSGPPGTGKTMAAEVIAAELDLDLYKIDLSTIVSKYIGETEKNLEKIFREAENSNAILFFDEADSLFGKRSEVRDSHDRYANIEISYLLQRMEAYDGVTILATNLRANLDEAFTRRLQFAVDFPFPEEEYRLRIWKTLFPPSVPHADELQFGLLAQRFKLAGGNIRNIIVNAAYLAASDGGQVTIDHLLHGTRRELQKMGRLLPEADLTV